MSKIEKVRIAVSGYQEERDAFVDSHAPNFHGSYEEFAQRMYKGRHTVTSSGDRWPVVIYSEGGHMFAWYDHAGDMGYIK